METYADLVQYLREAILRDTVKPYLWTDLSITVAIAAAHDELASRSLVLRDNTQTITLVTATRDYTLDPTVLAVFSARIEGQMQNLIHTQNPGLYGEPPAAEQESVAAWLEGLSATDAVYTGMPRVFTLDEGGVGAAGAITMSVYPIPTVSENGTKVLLRVARLPSDPCTLSTLSEDIELPRQLHMGLAYGAAVHLLRASDVDAEDRTRAERFAALFDKTITEAKQITSRKFAQRTAWRFNASVP